MFRAVATASVTAERKASEPEIMWSAANEPRTAFGSRRARTAAASPMAMSAKADAPWRSAPLVLLVLPEVGAGAEEPELEEPLDALAVDAADELDEPVAMAPEVSVDVGMANVDVSVTPYLRKAKNERTCVSLVWSVCEATGTYDCGAELLGVGEGGGEVAAGAGLGDADGGVLHEGAVEAEAVVVVALAVAVGCVREAAVCASWRRKDRDALAIRTCLREKGIKAYWGTGAC